MLTYRHIRIFFAAMISVTIVLSFTVHAVQVEHEHYAPAHSHATPHAHAESTGVAGESLVVLGEKMHLSDKKWFVFVATVSLYALSFLITPWSVRLQMVSASLTRRAKLLQQPPVTFESYLEALFAVGKLNPKLF